MLYYYYCVVNVSSFDEAVVEKEFQFMEEYESPADTDLLGIYYRVVPSGCLDSQNTGIEVCGYMIAEFCSGFYTDNRSLLVSRFDGSLDLDLFARSLLNFNSVRPDCIDIWFRATVQNRYFHVVDFNQGVVHSHSGKCGQAVLYSGN